MVPRQDVLVLSRQDEGPSFRCLPFVSLRTPFRCFVPNDRQVVCPGLPQYGCGGPDRCLRPSAHDSRGISASWALFFGAPTSDIMRAALWSSPNTFISYFLRVFPRARWLLRQRLCRPLLRRCRSPVTDVLAGVLSVFMPPWRCCLMCWSVTILAVVMAWRGRGGKSAIISQFMINIDPDGCLIL